MVMAYRALWVEVLGASVERDLLLRGIYAAILCLGMGFDVAFIFPGRLLAAGYYLAVCGRILCCLGRLLVWFGFYDLPKQLAAVVFAAPGAGVLVFENQDAGGEGA
jgi:hypothetical protein